MATAPPASSRSVGAPRASGRFETLPEPLAPRLGPLARARITAVVLWANLACQIGIIVTGGAVRLTGSGMGCSTWPNCEPGRFTPEFTPASDLRPLIEFGNRTLTGILAVVAILVLVVAVRWLRHRGLPFVLLAAVPLVGTALQAVIGGIVVRMHLHPGLVSPHLLLSLVLVAASAVLLVRAGDGRGPRRPAVPGAVRRLVVVLAVVGSAVVVLGTVVTGTGPHSGDSGDVVRILVDPVLVSRIHALAVWAFCAVLVVLLVLVRRTAVPRATRRAAAVLLLVTLLQGAIGYVQYLTGLPELLVGAHLLGAGLFVATLGWLGATLTTRLPAGADEPTRAGR